jgi:hypothetical protein
MRETGTGQQVAQLHDKYDDEKPHYKFGTTTGSWAIWRLVQQFIHAEGKKTPILTYSMEQSPS